MLSYMQMQVFILK